MDDGHVLFGGRSDADDGVVATAIAWREARPLPRPVERAVHRPPASIGATLQLLMNGLWAPAALLAGDGVIVVANEAWTQLAEQPIGEKLKLGSNYIAFNHEEALRGNQDRLAVLRALGELRAGNRSRCQVDLAGDAASEGRPFRVYMTALIFGDECYILVHRYEETDRESLRRQRQSVDGRLLRAQEEERRRIARDLHDSTSQLLVGLQFSIAQLKQTPLGTSFGPVLADCETALASIQREIRTLSYLCHPPLLGTLTLASALEALTRGFGDRAGLKVHLDLDEVRDVGAATEATLYRLTQEALANVYRHAKANSVGLRLTGTRNYVHLIVADDGIGFDPEHAECSPGVGLAGMKERVAQMAGRLSIRRLDPGTLLVASLPRVRRRLAIGHGKRGDTDRDHSARAA